MMNYTRHALKVAFLVAVVFPVAIPAATSTTATAEQYQQAYCIYMRIATVNMKAGEMDNVEQALQSASEAENAYLALDGTLALDARECPGVDLAATYEPEEQPTPEVGEEIRLAKQRILEARRKDTEVKRQEEIRERERQEEIRERERQREKERSRSDPSSNTALNALLQGLSTAAQMYGTYEQQKYAMEQQQESIRAAQVQKQLAYQQQQQQQYRNAQRIRTEQARRAEQERRAQQSWVERKVEDVLTTRRETFQLSARTSWILWFPEAAIEARCSLMLREDGNSPKSSGVTIDTIKERNRHIKGFFCGSPTVTSCNAQRKKVQHKKYTLISSSGHVTCRWKE